MTMEVNGIGLTNKIYYVNDLNFNNGYYQFDRHRTPQAYMELFPWSSLRWEDLQSIGSGNVIFIQTPTSNEAKKLSLLLSIIDSNTVFINQETNIFDWFDWTAEAQQLYIQCLTKCKAFCYHNEHDKKVMEVFVNKFIKYPGCVNLILDEVKNINTGQYISIAGPFKRYQRGMIVHKLIHDVVPNDIEVRCMKYNRPPEGAGITNLSFPDSYSLGNMKFQNFMQVDEWIAYIYNSKFGIDIQRDFSCGNNCIEFASLGVPLIGNIQLDCQRDIYPYTSFEYNDYDLIKQCISRLLKDSDFYQLVSKTALENVNKMYNSKTIIEKFKQDIINIL